MGRFGVRASQQNNFTKLCAAIAVALTLAGVDIFAVSNLSSSAKDTDTQAAAPATQPAPAVTPAAPAPHAVHPAAVTATHSQDHLAPAAPMNSSMPPVSVEEGIRDIRSPRRLPNPLLWAAYAAGALALALAAFAAWLWHRRSKLFAKLPYEIALDRLEEARRYMTPEQAREFCFAVSEVIRGYIELRFNARAAHRTTEEFLHDLLEAKQDKLVSHRVLLAQFLEPCDMAKFALWQFSVTELEAMHLSARTFVLQSAIDLVGKEDAANARAECRRALPAVPKRFRRPPFLRPPGKQGGDATRAASCSSVSCRADGSVVLAR